MIGDLLKAKMQMMTKAKELSEERHASNNRLQSADLKRYEINLRTEQILKEMKELRADGKIP